MTDTSGTLPKLRVGEILSDAFDFTYRNFLTLVKLAILPMLAMLCLYPLRISGLNFELVGYSEMVVETLSMAIFAAAIHRFYLLGGPPRLRFGRAEIKFAILTACILYLPAYASAVMEDVYAVDPMNHIGGFMALSTIFALITCYLSLRLSLIFPSIAITAQGGVVDYIKSSWTHMGGNVLALFLAFVVLAIVMLFITAIPSFAIFPLLDFQSAIQTGMPSFGMLLIMFFGYCTNLLYTVMTVLFASYAYKTLLGSGQIAVPQET